LFSFGAVLYEMATGKQAFDGSTTAVIYNAILSSNLTAPSQLNTGTPAQLEEIIGKALEKDREIRYQHASEMRADLKRLKRDTDSGRLPAATTTGRFIPVQTTARSRTPRRVIISAIILAVALAATVFFLFGRNTGAIDSIAVLPFANANPD